MFLSMRILTGMVYMYLETGKVHKKDRKYKPRILKRQNSERIFISERYLLNFNQNFLNGMNPSPFLSCTHFNTNMLE